MKDIKKALKVRKKIDPKQYLSKFYQDRGYLDIFIKAESEGLSPLQGLGVDHGIDLEKINKKDAEVPWGSLYNMSQEKFLILKKELIRLLDKDFIQVNKSVTEAPVLFMRKPGEGLYFCVDYRALNKISKKDRYPLPLIQEMLRQISKVN